MSAPRILLVEDSDDDALLVRQEIERAFGEVECARVETAEAFLAALRERELELIVCDHRLPTFSSTQALALLAASGLDVPLIIVSGSIGEERAVRAMRSGAADYILKNNLARLGPAIERELRDAAERRERRRVEAALRAEQERFRRIIETSHEGIWTVDAEARTTFVNARMAEMIGHTPAELIGRPVYDFLDQQEIALAMSSLDRTRLGTAWSAEFKLRRKDGEPRYTAVTATPILEDGRFVGAFAMVADVTEQKKLMSQLMVSDRMASVGTLAAGVAHEINNPLAVVIGNLELMAADLTDLTNGAESPDRARLHDELAQSLEDAREAAERVRLIVRDLKIFSRPEEEKLGAVDVRVVMESSLRMAWNEIRHRARLVKSYGDVPAVAANEARLGQVFLNLVINAAQAIEPGHADRNQLRVATRDGGAGRVIVEVADTGSGIPADVIGRIFDPFFSTKPIGVGTGLGLPICYRIVTGFGGEIGVESEPGKGSVFRVTLPIAVPAVEEPAPAAAPAPAPARRARVLVVDDDEMVARSLRRMIGPEHHVVVASSARAGAEACARERFDVILCDLMMPEMTGMDLHAELARVAPEQAARMVFMTGGAFTPDARSFLERVPNERLEKPFDVEALRAIIRRFAP